MRYNYYGKSLACLAMMLGFATAGFAQVDVGTGSSKTTYSTLKEAIANAPSGNTICLTQDVTETGSISFEGKALTLNLKGFKLILNKEGDANANLTVGSGATLKVQGGLAATLSVDTNDDYKVTYQGKNGKDQGTLQLDGTIYAKDGGYIYIASGNIVSTNGVALFAVGDKAGVNSINSKIFVEDGYVKAQEFAVSAQGNGATVIIGPQSSSKAGPVLEALDNAVVGGNGNNTDTEKCGGTDITILSATLIGRIQTPGYVACGIYHPQQGKLTIGYNAKIYAIGGCGILMRGGTMTMGGSASIVATGDKALTGKVGDSLIDVGVNGIVYDYDCGYYDSKNVQISVNGYEATPLSITSSADAVSVINTSGADVSSKISLKNGLFSSDVSKYADIASGYSCEKEGDVYHVANYVAQIGGVKWNNLRDAVANAKDGETVLVLKDYVARSYQLVPKHNVTLDLNGKHVTCYSVKVSGTGSKLTIRDSGASSVSTYALRAIPTDITTGLTGGILEGVGSDGYTVLVDNGGVATLESGTVVNTYTTKNNTATSNVVFRAEGDNSQASEVKSTINIYGGTVKTVGTPVAVLYKGATVNVNGGTLEGSGLAAIAGNGTTEAGGTIVNINGGSLLAHAPSDGTASCGIYNPQDGVVKVLGGTITSEQGPGILMRSGKLNMTGGNVIAKSTEGFTGTVGDAKFNVAASGIILDRDANYPAAANAEVTIQGEDVKVSGAKAAVELLNTNDAADAKNAVRVVSGTFSSDVSKYCADNYTAVPKGDGTYGIETGDVVLVSDNSYQKVSAGETLEFNVDKINKFLVNNDVAGVTVKMTKNFSTTNWAAFYVPFEIALTGDLLNNVEFAELWDTELDKNTNGTTLEFIKLKTGEKLSAHAPCLIKAKSQGEKTLEFPSVKITKAGTVSDCSTIKQKFTFYGTLENTTLLDKNGYFIDPATQMLMAVNNSTAFVSPCKFYMTIQNRSDESYVYPTTDIQQAKGFSFRVIGDDEVTGINEVDKDAAKAGIKIYNLQGVYVGNDVHSLRRGIYVINGSKVVVK